MSTPAKAAPVTTPVAITANDLRGGQVVWLTADGGWSPALAVAHVWPPAEAEQALALGRAAERANQVVGAYLVAVDASSGTPRPLKFRERLRATGPSIDAEPAPMLVLAS